MLYIGCHLSSSKGYENMGRQALSIYAGTFQFFSRNPRGGAAKSIDPADVARLREIVGREDFGPLVVHAPYTLNPCSKEEKTRNFARMAMEEDLARMEYLPGNYYNFHPGSHVGQGTEEGIRLIAGMLNDVLKPEQSATVLLETMAGKGSEIGGRFEELAAIRQAVAPELRDKVGICLDTCHVHDGGYDIVEDLDGVLQEFDDIIGLSHLKALHINDSMNPRGARKDRHAKIGEGCIGTDAIVRILRHPALQGLPCILETPQEDLSGYGEEIKMLKSLYKGEEQL